MNAFCIEPGCGWHKRGACPECLEEIAERHRTDQQHPVRVVGVDETRYGAIIDTPNHPFPQWMRGKQNV